MIDTDNSTMNYTTPELIKISFWIFIGTLIGIFALIAGIYINSFIVASIGYWSLVYWFEQEYFVYRPLVKEWNEIMREKHRLEDKQ